MKNHLKTRLACVVALGLVSGLACAQAVDPSTPSPAPPALSAPDAPGASLGNLESVAAPPASPVTSIQQSPIPSVSNASEASNDDLVRDIARYRTQEGRLSSLTALEMAQLAREKARIQARLELLEINKQAFEASRPTDSKPSVASSSTESAAVAEVVLRPQVRSIYGHGDNAFAEIYIGSAKIVATRGTVLSTGERVVDISPAGVAVVKNGRRQVLQVAGSAGTQPITPLSRP